MNGSVSIPPIAMAVVVAATLDRLVAEPPEAVHPVALFGRIVAPIDREWRHPNAVGTVAAVLLPLGAAGLAWFVVSRAAAFDPVLGGLFAGAVLFSTTSLRMLLREAGGVVTATGHDPEAARDRLLALAGRDSEALSPGQLRSAAVESVAENLSDGLVAPLLAFVVFAPLSIALGAAAAAGVKAVNTMDSMLGYPSIAVGTFPARLDDVVMWIPARVTALLLAVVGGKPGTLRAARRWTDAPASPNAGWPMATMAVVLGVRLQKPGRYDLDPTSAAVPNAPEGSVSNTTTDPSVPTDSFPSVEAAERGIEIGRRAGIAAYGVAAIAGVIAWL